MLGFKVFEGFKVVEKGVVGVAIVFVFCLGVCWLTSYARVKAYMPYRRLTSRFI